MSVLYHRATQGGDRRHGPGRLWTTLNGKISVLVT